MYCLAEGKLNHHKAYDKSTDNWKTDSEMIPIIMSLAEYELEEEKCFELQLSCLCVFILYAYALLKWNYSIESQLQGTTCVINIYFLSECIDSALSGLCCLL